MTRRAELLQALDATPRDLARAVRGLPPPVTGTRPAPDQWSPADIVHHLISVETCTLARFHRVAEETNPTLLLILPDLAHHFAAPLDDLLAHFPTARAQTLAYLTPLSSGVWARPAHFEDGSKTTFRYLVQALVDHDTEHLNQLVEVKRVCFK
jgi:hypothetical protein